MIVRILGFLINLIGIASPRLAGRISLKLFSSPRRIKIKEKQRDFLETAFLEDVDIKITIDRPTNLTIKTYRWLGNRETVLLAHGWESNSYRWKGLIQKLKALDYNIVALDAPAHGYSSGSTFNAILYAECINIIAKKFKANIIVGHSVGGMSAAFFQNKYQMPTVKKIILLGAPSNFEGVFSRYVKMMGYSKRVARAMDELIYKRFKYMPEHFNAAKFSKDITAKGLIIHDKLDKIIPYSDAEDFQNFYKNAKFISTEGFGHGLRNEEVENHVVAFIEQ